IVVAVSQFVFSDTDLRVCVKRGRELGGCLSARKVLVRNAGRIGSLAVIVCCTADIYSSSKQNYTVSERELGTNWLILVDLLPSQKTRHGCTLENYMHIS
ncbi:unnamed protein product, partial [Discosporangium mesarthrocarpum]